MARMVSFFFLYCVISISNLLFSSGLLFTYGVTSAGKTHTVTGSPEQPGILPRTLDIIFNTIVKTGLQTRKYSFKPDNHNGFSVNPTADVMLQRFMDLRKTASSNSVNGSKKSNSDNSVLGDWGHRQEINDFIKDLDHDYNYSIFVSYVENYNKYIYDLLDEVQPDQLYPLRSHTGVRPLQQQAPRQLRENPQKQVYIQDLTEVEVTSAEEALELFLKGNLRRKMGSTKLNADSSRSHSIFTIRLVRAPLNINGTEILPDHLSVTQLSIVDLAGCERTQRTGATGNRLKEAAHINNSLLTLRSCMEALRDNQRTSQPGKKMMIPYRDSRLTMLFKSFFEGGGKVNMILCLNPGSADVDETVNVLKFGEVSKDVLTSKIDHHKAVSFDDINFDDYSPSTRFQFPDRWLESPDDDKIMELWDIAVDQFQSNKTRVISSITQEMQEVRRGFVTMEQQSVLLREELGRINNDKKAIEEKSNKQQEEMLCLQRESEKLQRNVRIIQKSSEDFKKKYYQSENQRSQINNDYQSLKDNIENFFEAHHKETSKLVSKLMKNKEEQLREMECLNRKKLEIAAKILEDDDDYVLKNLKGFSAEKLWKELAKNKVGQSRATKAKGFFPPATAARLAETESEVSPIHSTAGPSSTQNKGKAFSFYFL